MRTLLASSYIQSVHSYICLISVRKLFFIMGTCTYLASTRSIQLYCSAVCGVSNWFWIFCHVATIRQFDTMIFPEQKNKASGLSGWYNKGVEFLTRSGPDHPRFDVPSAYKMRLQCMKMYLEPYKKTLLRGEFHKNFDISNAVTIITDLCNCCTCQYCGTSVAVHPWEFSSLNNVSTHISCAVHECNRKFAM